MKPRKILVLGSGPLQIGQAGEFDYSGSQALKALREEGIQSVLVNPNIATVQTSPDLADRIYFVPVTPDQVEKIIERERVDGILLAFGGQTALNCGIELERRGVLAKHGVSVLGTPLAGICDTEDRHVFAERLRSIDVSTPRSIACMSVSEAYAAVDAIGLPVMLRAGYSLGGKGSSLVECSEDVEPALQRAFAGGAVQVLVEESLRGWKEIEYEVVRDCRDNCITVCNMENVDPMGIHTGESIVVAPSQTLDDAEYQLLRRIAIRCAREFGIVGECNVQFALNPERLEYRVIEMNARLSRSSALASKATGYPLAYIAARLALGYALDEVTNEITGKTTAYFEPAMDYLVCKIPRWDLIKFGSSVKELGSEMKSVGEVMAIGRSFPEVIQKALRMLDIGVKGLDANAYEFVDLRRELRYATPRRVFAIARAIREGMDLDEIRQLTRIDAWFLREIQAVVGMQATLEEYSGPLDRPLLEDAKRLGFADHFMDDLMRLPRGTTRSARIERGVRPHLAQIDTTAAEFPAQTNYLYSTYHAASSEVERSTRRKILVLGSGAYRIGSSVEFDWCCVSAVKAARKLGFETVMLNYNPETVSTDYDICDRLVFDEVSLESVLDLCEQERPDGVVVSMGGQIPNSLALRLHQAGIPILGTRAADIDRAEDRLKFSALLDELGIEQPCWAHATDIDDAARVAAELGGFPVLVRPSYVLSGAAMSVAHETQELKRILQRAKRVSAEHPVVISKFEEHAREVEIDAVASRGTLIHWAICEHVENAGVHSGDATLVLPPQTLYLPTIRRIRQIATDLARALEITGPFNVQFLAKNNVVKVIECNLRAARSFPFVSKVLGVNFAEEALRCMLGEPPSKRVNSLELDHVGVKVPMFSFGRLVGADPLLGVEMSSTGEAACIGATVHDALLLGMMSTGFRMPKTGVLLSLGPVRDKFAFTDEARFIVDELKLPIFATPGTATMLREVGVDSIAVDKGERGIRTAREVIKNGAVDLVINVPREYDSLGRPDGYLIRRAAIDSNVCLLTDLQLARAVIEALRHNLRHGACSPRAWGDFVGSSDAPTDMR
jgi:carbamoyl-phosphate synthase large subunit